MTDLSTKIARLVAMGGREWKSGDKHRVYFDAKTANAFAGIEKLLPSGYSFAGEKISTYRFKEISLDDFHFDVIEGVFQVSGRWKKETFAAAVAEVNRRLASEPDAETTQKMESVELVHALDEERSQIERALDQLQKDAEALAGGEDDPAYPAMAARYEELTARLEAIKAERLDAARKMKGQ